MGRRGAPDRDGQGGHAVTEKPTAIGWLVFPLRLILGGLFMLAGYLKLSAVPVFAGAILGFKLNLPDHIVIGSAFVVPWVEIIAGAMLVLGFWTRAAAALIGALLLAFIAMLGSVIFRGIDAHCSCFGKFEFPCDGPIGWCHIIRNTVLLGMTLTVGAWGPGPLAIDRESTK